MPRIERLELNCILNMREDSNIKIRTRDIPTSWLNARCRNLISKYALIAFRLDGSIFDLRDELILTNLSQHSRITEAAELRALYTDLKAELRVIASSPSNKTALVIMAEKFDFLGNNTPQ